MAVTNTLAYYGAEFIMAITSFIIQAKEMGKIQARENKYSVPRPGSHCMVNSWLPGVTVASDTHL